MNTSDFNAFGFKQVTLANFDSPDDAAALWRQMTALAKTKEEWITFFSGPRLHDKVPLVISQMLEVLRGSMLYSWFYYPLATLGAQQCYRIVETGVRLRREQAGISTVTKTKAGEDKYSNLFENINSLIALNIIPKSDAKAWGAIRGLRNMYSHPNHQPIYDPGQAESALTWAVDILNALFR